MKAARALLMFVVIFVVTAFGYYFYHDDLARLYLRYGVVLIPVFGGIILALSLIVSRLTGMPLVRTKRPAPVMATDATQKLVWPQLLLGVAVGLVFLVPVLFLLIWVMRL